MLVDRFGSEVKAVGNAKWGFVGLGLENRGGGGLELFGGPPELAPRILLPIIGSAPRGVVYIGLMVKGGGTRSLSGLVPGPYIWVYERR